ncbi:MAG: hypothetical protein JWM82_3958 [Myxococcales bacterium]|nr:hypothetical protein [Myxococcales bacterium]
MFDLRGGAVACVSSLAAAAALAVGAGGCGRGRGREGETRETASLAEALSPAYFARALHHVGGAHFHGTARFAAGMDAPDDGVTTTTDVWLDRGGNWRLAEVNDRDGGRDVALVGRELFVALRYGKMIRRVAEEPEPTRLLEEALGAPWAAWEIVRPQVAIERIGTKLVGGPKATEYGLARAAARTDDQTAPAPAGLRAWRAHVTVDEVSGHALVDDATGALVQIELAAKFTTKRDGHDLHGALDVHGTLSDLTTTAPVMAPPSEELALRQRLVPEQRELLAGLPSSRGAPATPPRMKAAASPKAPAGAPKGAKAP